MTGIVMSDRQIATHEAGHALVAHLLGQRIDHADLDKGSQAAAVLLADGQRPFKATSMAGSLAEFLTGHPIYSGTAKQDMHHAEQGEPGPEEPRALDLLNNHRDALDALADWFTTVRTNRDTIPGEDIHAFLDSFGVPFASEAVHGQA